MSRIRDAKLAGGKEKKAESRPRAGDAAGAWRVGGSRQTAPLERKGTGAECVAFYLRDLASYPEIHSWQSQGLSREKDVTLEQKAVSMSVCLISGLGGVSKA